MDGDLEEQGPKRIKLEIADRPLNFAINPDDYDIQCVKKPKTPRDPMSHRIIEKRRRDRMNNCLAELSRLIPSNYLKQGQGRIEKTEIIEMASKHIRHLQNLTNFHGGKMEQFHVDGKGRHCCEEKFYMGFKECQDEMLRYLIEVEGRDIKEGLCTGVISHLDQTSKKFLLNPSVVDKEPLGDDKKEENIHYLIDDCSRSSDQSIAVPMYQPNMDSPGMPNASYNTQHNSQSLQNSGNGGNKNNYLRTLLMPKDLESGMPGSGISGLNGVRSPLKDGCGQMLSVGNMESTYGSSRADANMSVNGSGISDRLSNSSSGGSEKTLNVCDSDQSSNSYAASGSGNISNGGSSHDSSVYKFKHNITKRFSQEEKRELHPAPPSDTSSSSSREEEMEKVKRKYPRQFIRHKARGNALDSSQSGLENPLIYPNNKYGHGISNVYSHCNEKDESGAMDVPLPAFVLNPDGTHYIPISIHPSHLGNIIPKKESSELQTYHPISIPVNFGGPHITMRSISTMPPNNTNALDLPKA
ncbi:hypothetical protein FSP39_018468 [Pinctada imbricata]|uniref:BHLH domain-containing protein n=1 Tax=Pinctada imbricata TaxID=66713 RepID=A0AA89C0D7_PINIB|nr:hypothetical protein FSP39_018468 [Pinctada imbricata]